MVLLKSIRVCNFSIVEWTCLYLGKHCVIKKGRVEVWIMYIIDVKWVQALFKMFLSAIHSVAIIFAL